MAVSGPPVSGGSPRRRRSAPPPIVDDNPVREESGQEPAAQQPPGPAPAAHEPAGEPQAPPNGVAHMLAAGQQGGALDAFLAAMAASRQKRLDPDEDYVAAGTRQVRYVQAAIEQQAALLGISQQSLLRDVMLGRRRLEPRILDATYQTLYGQPRPPEGREE